MIQFKKLAIASAVAASIMAAGSAQAHVSYNYTTATGGEPPAAIGTNSNVANRWTSGSWTGGSPLAQGYTGNLPATWLANINNAGEVYEVSKANAIEEGDPDGAGPLASVVSSAFKLESANNKWNPSNSWGNALDYGLINLQVAGDLTIKVQAESGSLFQPGFTLWKNWDATATSNKHGGWQTNANSPNRLGSNELVYVGHASTTSSGNGINYSYNSSTQAVEITFAGLTAGHYSLWIGGNGSGNTSNNQQYLAEITAVPVPGAVWLFGSAMAGLLGFGRRKATRVAA